MFKSFFGSAPQTPGGPTTARGLPASWYSSKKMYELERRAIFSKRWIMITHRCRFAKAGDYLSYTVAGYSFVLCLDRKGKLGGFHNVCRHRGFPLIHDNAGNAKIFACKYHGWSYGIDGKLAKAPYFDGFSDFDKDENGLLPIHVHIDQLGFIWVNLEAAKKPSMTWQDQFGDVDVQSRFQRFDFSGYRFDHAWSAEGNFNWKTLADNYNECLHCKVAHPDVADNVNITVYRVQGHQSHLQHYNNIEAVTSDGKELDIGSTYYFPINCMTISPEFFYFMRCVPTSESTVSMEYEVYRHIDATEEGFERMDALFKRILTEDKWLCNATQKNLNAGVYVNGQLHPNFEEGPLYFQSLVKQAVLDHRAQEEKEKREIWPATQTIGGSSCTEEERKFCAKLESDAMSSLAW